MGLVAVLLIDANSKRRKQVANALRSRLGIKIQSTGAAGELPDPAEICSTGDIVAIAIDSNRRAALEWVASMAKNGGAPICYADRSNDWPIAARCRPILAGASALLDSEATDFSQLIAARVQSQVEAAKKKRTDGVQLERLMSRCGVVGASKSIRRSFRSAVRISQFSDVPVLVTGESGTGKELISRAIHSMDPRRSKAPFVAVNCGAISDDLVESEFFGHRKGAFTGADQARAGFVRAARNGVLFLDEIGDLAPALQATLLRVLQDGRVLAIGEDRDEYVDFRVGAATNKDLDELVRRREFRLDLLHRLKVGTIHLEPLRKRTADIETLLEHFVHKHQIRESGLAYTFSREVIDALAQLELPGNARELENLVRNCLVTSSGVATTWTIADLPKHMLEELCVSKPVGAQSPESGAPGWATDVLDTSSWNLSKAMNHCEKLFLEAALASANNNQTKAARLLGITARSVYNKLRKHSDHPIGR